jgi:peptidoglycan/xylan/chitin deacetylase (PgdA/CDA1 family)
MSEPGVVFLMYHELELPGRPLCQTEPGYVRYIVRESDFRSHMERLKQSGWRGVSVSEAVRSLAPQTTAVTFDDGCETDLLYAAPILREFDFGGTFYLTTGFLGRRGYLSQPQARELGESGFEVGCHSMTHAYLTDLDDKDLKREVAEAKVELEQIIGKPVEHFSCPGGRYNQRVAASAQEAGYRTVATSHIHANLWISDPFALGRVAVMRSATLDAFDQICRGQNLWRMRWEVELRTAMKKLLGNTAYDRLRSALLRDRVSE